MTLYGYVRVSTTDQDLSVQEAALRAAGCQVIGAEKWTGAQRERRTELEPLMQVLRAGDTLVVTRIDRLGIARSSVYRSLPGTDKLPGVNGASTAREPMPTED